MYAAAILLVICLQCGLHPAWHLSIVAYADGPSTPTSSHYAYGMTIGESTNIRKEPSTKADLVKRMKAKGTPVEVQSSVTNKEGELWYSIVFGAYTGYVRADLLEEISLDKYNERQAAMGGMPVGGLFVLSPEQAEIVGGATAPGARIGNTKTSKYHMPACEYLPETVYQVSFASRDAAEMAGYVPCKVCAPD